MQPPAPGDDEVALGGGIFTPEYSENGKKKSKSAAKAKIVIPCLLSISPFSDLPFAFTFIRSSSALSAVKVFMKGK